MTSDESSSNKIKAGEFGFKKTDLHVINLATGFQRGTRRNGLAENIFLKNLGENNGFRTHELCFAASHANHKAKSRAVWREGSLLKNEPFGYILLSREKKLVIVHSILK